MRHENKDEMQLHFCHISNFISNFVFEVDLEGLLMPS